MDFAISEEQQMIQDTACSFAQKELAPIANAVGEGAESESFLANLLPQPLPSAIANK